MYEHGLSYPLWQNSEYPLWHECALEEWYDTPWVAMVWGQQHSLHIHIHTHTCLLDFLYCLQLIIDFSVTYICTGLYVYLYYLQLIIAYFCDGLRIYLRSLQIYEEKIHLYQCKPFNHRQNTARFLSFHTFLYFVCGARNVYLFSLKLRVVKESKIFRGRENSSKSRLCS